ncbi:MAG: MarR family winged helix-turn-helix transcriptional regulator [Desertimonas sp.]
MDTVDVVSWLDEGEMAAWRAFIETVHDLLRALENDLAEESLTLGDYQVLVYLAEAERPLRMSDLASRLQLTPSGLTRRLDGLVRSGDVERIPDEQDRRVMLAQLTERGHERLQEAAPQHVRSVRERFLEPCDSDDQQALARAFLAMRERLNGDEANGNGTNGTNGTNGNGTNGNGAKGDADGTNHNGTHRVPVRGGPSRLQ